MAKFRIPQWAAYLGDLDEPLAGDDLRKSVEGSSRNMGFAGPQALDGVPQDGSVDGQDPREVSSPCTGPDPPSPAGGDRSGESAATSRKWAGAGAVLVHDSQGGSARALALQLQLTPAVDVTRLLGTAIWGPDWALGWVKFTCHIVG